MADDTAISITDVSKKFLLFDSPVDRLKEALNPFGRAYHKEFWALRDINLEIPKGATFGIMGRNGAGKSTLLHLITSIQQPTTGSIRAEGRVSSLELGAGFNPEFTGRENLMIHGRIMGHSKGEMQNRISEIEAFAGIGDFINHPIKTYSTGMYMRLAFAAAIDMNPDILTIDEVLSVGDAKFQRKCFQKLEEFQNAGKTIIIVSHSIQTITQQCDRVILLENGRVIADGTSKKVADLYMEWINEGSTNLNKKIKNRKTSPKKETEMEQEIEGEPRDYIAQFLQKECDGDSCPDRKSYNANEHCSGNMQAAVLDYLVVCNNTVDPSLIRSGDVIKIYLKIKAYKKIENPVIGYRIITTEGILLAATSSRFHDVRHERHEAGVTKVYMFSIRIVLQEGDIFLGIGISDRGSEKGKDAVINARQDMIHLKVFTDAHRFDGYVDLETEFAPPMDVK